MNRKFTILFGVLIFLFIISASYTVIYAVKVATLSIVPEANKNKPVQKRYHFVLISHEKDNPYWQTIKKGAEEAGLENGIYIEYIGPIRANVQEHIQLIEMSIAAKVDGILTQGLTDEAFTPVINKAIEKGIPVILIDTDAPKSKRYAYIGTNNYYSGYLAGLKMRELLDNKGKVGVITGSFVAENMQLRLEGFKDALKNTAEIEIVAIESSEISQVEAEEKALKIVEENPSIDGLFGNSALDGIGIAKALSRLQLTKKVKVVAFDNLPETLSLLKAGVIDATITQEPYKMGYMGVEKLLEIKQGKVVTDKIINTSSYIITGDDIVKWQDQKDEYQK